MKNIIAFTIMILGLMVSSLTYEVNAQVEMTTPEAWTEDTLLSDKEFESIDTTYTLKQDEKNNNWYLYGRTLDYLNAKDKSVLVLHQRWDQKDSSWYNQERTVRDYNRYGKESRSLYQEWNKNFEDWIHVKMKTISYDGRNKSEVLYQEWMKPAGEWINSMLYLLEYNHKGEKSNIMIRTYSPSTDSWTNSQRYTFEYKEGYGYPDVVYLEKWKPSSKTWDRQGRYLLDHNMRGKKTFESRATWNEIRNEWVNSIRYMMEYQKDNITKEIEQRYNYKTKEWINANRFLYQYNKEGELELETRQKWDSATNGWQTTGKFKYTDVKNLIPKA